MSGNTIIKIKDSVDLFLSNETYLMAYYMNTRQRKSFRINIEMVHLLEEIDGKRSIDELCECMKKTYHVSPDSTKQVIDILISNRIVTVVNDKQELLSSALIERYNRQINYFSEFLGSEAEGILAQKKLINSRVVIFGCGAVGGDIALQLAMAGVGYFTLFDFDRTELSDVSRHIYYREKYIGMSKVNSLSNELKVINPEIQVNSVQEVLRPDSDISELLEGADFVVNTLDEPYIGYTASKISRACMKKGLPHYIAGGFDAHLSSTGELIIPFVTPCVECYADHFKVTLKDWKPQKHPVVQRYSEIGGLSCLSLFSSSYACIEIIKCITGIVKMNDNYQVRGEFLFHDMSLQYINIKRNPDCPICGGKNGC